MKKFLPKNNEEEEENTKKEENTPTPTPGNSEKEKETTEEKLIIDTDKNCLYKKGNEKKGIKEYVVDFYPVNFAIISLNVMVNYVEMKKDEKEGNKKMKEKNEIEKQKKMRTEQYMEKMNELNEYLNKGMIEDTLYKEKMDLLNEHFKDVFENKKKEKTKMKKSEFLELFKTNANEFIYSRKNRFEKYSRFSTMQEIKDIIIKCNNNLKNGSFNILYYTLEKELIKPDDESTFIDNGIGQLMIIVVDIKDDEGLYTLSILEKNENESEDEEKKNENNNKIKEKNEIQNLDLMSKEELKKIKENLNEKEKQRKQQEKLEREKIEKMEKERKEKLKKEKEKKAVPPFGIPNFGNTCYFNSINQIFINLPIMQELFKNEKLQFFINKDNKFGYKGKFIDAFMPLYDLYPSEINGYAKNLKSLAGKLRDTFNNREQQDANEYLNFVLEALHEELNLKSAKKYIIEKDENYKYNTEEELGNIAWANNLRRNVSFIDSIFMFQLKSNLTCKRCGTKKVKFENNYVFDLPLSVCKMITVEIHLYRLPFIYKIYFDKIDKNFSDFVKSEENKNNNILENLRNYYTNKLSYEQKLEHAVHTYFEFDFERQKQLGDLIKVIRNINLLNLEPEDYDININNREITEYKIKHFTDFIIYFKNTKIVKTDTVIDKLVDMNDKIRLNIYEVLNTNGYSLIYKKLFSDLNIFSYKIKRKKAIDPKEYEKIILNANYNNNFKDGKTNSNKNKDTNEEDSQSTISSSSSSINGDTPTGQNNKNENMINLISLNDKILYYEEEVINNISNDQKTNNKNKILTEYFIPIVHYRRDLRQGRGNLFLDFYHSSLGEFPQQFIVFNNSNYYQITPKYLYDYIWDYNSLYMNHPNKKNDKFWWNLDPNSNNHSKKCYPFILRIVRKKKNFSFSYDCAKCQWYNFCFGCALYPDDDKPLEIKSDCTIFVDWCNSLIKEEVESCNFNLKRFSNEEITQCIESSAKNDKNKQYQSITDCFEFFFEKELLEDPLSCRICGGPENFYKNYEINKLPYVLILSLKRFKFNENNGFKLRQLITYPLYDFTLKNQKYDLFGVVYHYGGINSGHYICTIKRENKWIMCDDRRVEEVDEGKIMNSNAYILFYISKESINNNSYYNCMKSLMQHLVINKATKEIYINDNNYFQGEPVNTPYGEGYVMKDYLNDFIKEENNKKEDTKENNENKNEENKDEKDEKENQENKETINKNEINGQSNENTINKNGLVEIKFDFGKGTVYVDNITKQILEDS